VIRRWVVNASPVISLAKIDRIHLDKILEKIYSDRRFKNVTERLEKLFEPRTKMTSQQNLLKKASKPKGAKS
jgi:predicted nucleic acid-binding protein